MRRVAVVLVTCGLVGTAVGVRSSTPQAVVEVIADPGVASIQFGAGELRDAVREAGLGGSTGTPRDLGRQAAAGRPQIVVAIETAPLPGQPSVQGLADQGFAIRRVQSGNATQWWIVGHDAVGAMYGALDVAETVRIGRGLSQLAERQVNPAVRRRGIKFNIPLDARTPSYSDDSTSAQANIAEMWSMAFWSRFLDDMARHRYNVLSLWSLSPFPSLVKVPEYPNVALADVKRKAGPLWDATLQGRNMYDPRWELETVRRMTIDEKIAFWRSVMQYAKDRGIDITLFTWNIFVYGTESSGYGITDKPDNPVTRDYVRRSVRALFATYPLLAGIGVTTGENMGNLNDAGKEQWAWDTYGLGVKDAIEDARNPSSPAYRPDRRITLIHRAHQADLQSIVAKFHELPGYDAADSTLDFSFKYSQAHTLSTTTPRFIYQNDWFATIPAGKQTWLEVRTDDLYDMRWSDPEFSREYLTHLPDASKIAGFVTGPDGYTWGREFLSKRPDSPRQLVIDKFWYSFLIWGRLAYEPSLPDSRFEAILGAHFPGVPAGPLFRGWASVSQILPLVTRFYWGSLDFMWYPEACWSNTGFATVQDFITPKYPPMREDEDGQTPRLMSVKAFVDGDPPAGRLTPPEVADAIERRATTGADLVQPLVPGGNAELRDTLDDITAMAWLGRYYAEKIRGAVELYRYQKTGDAAARAAARAHLETAARHWAGYAALWSAHYQPQVLTRMGLTPVDIAGIQKFVDEDIEMVK